MNTAETSPEIPSALTGYPTVATDAFLRYQASREASDLEIFLLRALDFLLERDPSKSLVDLPKETRLMDDLGADSLLVAELVFLLEDLFEMRLDNQALAAVSSLGDLQALVQREARS